MTIRSLFAVAAVTVVSVGCSDGEPAECGYDYSHIKAEEMTAIDKGMTVYRRLAHGEATPDTLFDQERAELERAQAILASRSRPVDALDLAVLDGALSRLDDDARWDRNDDRECATEDETVSLYCALYFASLEYLGRYEHRRTAMQEVRFAIEDATDGREFEHRLMDFNNLPDTSLADVRGVIRTARDRVAARLVQQADCALEY